MGSQRVGQDGVTEHKYIKPLKCKDDYILRYISMLVY